MLNSSYVFGFVYLFIYLLSTSLSNLFILFSQINQHQLKFHPSHIEWPITKEEVRPPSKPLTYTLIQPEINNHSGLFALEK